MNKENLEKNKKIFYQTKLDEEYDVIFFKNHLIKISERKSPPIPCAFEILYQIYKFMEKKYYKNFYFEHLQYDANSGNVIYLYGIIVVRDDISREQIYDLGKNFPDYEIIKYSENEEYEEHVWFSWKIKTISELAKENKLHSFW